ncbi:serine/threonine-protein kinase [Kamptonema formosum]|uniref:serine/threonine-protein kinase n=1 Tax=Kamptonema formosum TaxID=331992 RepID=UPI00034AA27A|nr:serine/threonine-protein kinase [Oscillatoria sp. PCC 10802]
MSHCINPKFPNPQNRDTQMFCSSCGSELLLEARYRVMRLLGQGGCGKTFEVSDRDGTPKVLKILINNHPKYLELFQREALVLSQLNHPGIPRVEPDAYFTFSPKNSTEPLHCLVMEKIEGLDLSEYQQLRPNRPISQKVAIEWLTQLAAVLQEVHSQNFFHRDIKPSNIMLRADGNLVLIDFGTVRAVTGTYVAKQAAGQVTGVVSAGYTPPEQINGQAVPQSDFFALGRTFVYLLTGKEPGEFYDATTDELRWRNSAAGISPVFADLIDSLMVRLASQRPQTAKEILQKLAEINRALYPPKPPVPVSPSPNSAPANAPALLPLRPLLAAIPPPVLLPHPLPAVSPLPILLLIALLLGVGVPALAYFFIPEFKDKIIPELKYKINSLIVIDRTGKSR